MYVFIVFIFLLMSCKNQKKENEKFINAFAYLKGQLRHLDTVPYGILKIKQIDSVVSDSVYIDVKEVRKMTAPFLALETDEDYFNENFTQSVFGDATIGTITISYQAKKNKEPVERIDVYANPLDGEIKQIYLLKRDDPSGNIGKQQLLWTHNKGFSIFESASNQNSQASNIVYKVILQ